jgi:hypothetical protein
MYIDNINISAVNVVGVSEVEPETILGIYPNPVAENGTLHLYSNLNEMIMVELYSMEGKRVYRKQHGPMADIMVTGLAGGPYIYVLSSSKLINKGVLVVQ